MEPKAHRSLYRGSEFVLLRFGRFRRNFHDSRDVPPFRTDSRLGEAYSAKLMNNTANQETSMTSNSRGTGTVLCSNIKHRVWPSWIATLVACARRDR